MYEILGKLRRLTPKRIVDRLSWYRKTSMLRRTVGHELEGYQETLLLYLLELEDVKGKRILEIGGDVDGKVARALRKLGCEWVTTINRVDGFATQGVEDAVERIQMDARDLNLPKNSYDLVFGIAVLEHLRDIETVVDSLHSVTRLGGHVYLHGAPLWNCHNGHHLWVSGSKGQHYRFNSSSNPIPKWGHLLMDRASMSEYLNQFGYDPVDIESMVEWVYGTERINRYSATYLKEIFSNSDFDVQQCRESESEKPDHDTSARLAEKFSLPSRDFYTCGISFYLEKTRIKEEQIPSPAEPVHSVAEEV